MTVSLIILTCNRKDSVSALLSDIKRQVRQPDEIIVVDNNSSDGTSAYLAMSFPEVQAVKLEKNMGAAGRNEGIKRARGEIIVTLDDDVFFGDTGGIKKIVEIFKKNKDIVALNFKILDHETRDLLSFNWFHPYKMEDYADTDFITDYISEGAVAFRREIFDRVGYYPKEFFISHEGPDLAYRILDAGYNIHYSPDIEVLHKCSTQHRDSWRNTYYDTRNQIWLAVRNLPFLKAALHIGYRLVTTFLFAVRRKQLSWYFKAVFDAIKEIKTEVRYRKPISKATLRRLKEIRKNRPGLWYQFGSFLKRTRLLHDKFRD